MNSKKESTGYMPGSHSKAALPIDSTISISNLLDYVNKYFDDVLSTDVLKHYGKTSRQKTNVSDSVKYQDRNTTQLDNDYLSAVNRGDLETAQRMVDEEAMYWKAYSKDSKVPFKVYHGTLKGGFNIFGGRNDFWYFSGSKKVANIFAGYKENGQPSELLKNDSKGNYYPQIYEAYLKIHNPFITEDKDIIEDAFYWDNQRRR